MYQWGHKRRVPTHIQKAVEMPDLIQPVQRGEMLLADIASAQPKPHEVHIWWLGQSGYAIKTQSTLFYTDLYLSEHLTKKYADTDKPHVRMTESALRGGDLTSVEWVFSSHKHSDHLDPGTMADLFAASPNAKLILPAAIVDHAVGLGLDRHRLIPTRGAETIRVSAMTVHSIPAAHPGLDYSEDNGYSFLGFVIEVDGLTIYHSGDTLYYDGLDEHLKPFAIDVAFLPINGTDEKRLAGGTPPNMGIEDAVRLAKTHRPQVVIPHHYDMFTFNTADVADFEKLAADAAISYAVLRCGEHFVWRKAQ